MDGTLLDLHFDNYFWLEYVPQCYAKKNKIEPDKAHEKLMAQYKSVEGTMDWYCLDYWTEQLDLDIVLLKEQVAHLIQVHPHVFDFLDKLKKMNIQRILVTNAHQKSLDLKLRKTPIGNYLDEIITSHEYGLPKEDIELWSKLQEKIHFNPKTTALIDDNTDILQSAQQFGILQLLAISLPDSKKGRKTINNFPAIDNFREVLY